MKRYLPFGIILLALAGMITYYILYEMPKANADNHRVMVKTQNALEIEKQKSSKLIDSLSKLFFESKDEFSHHSEVLDSSLKFGRNGDRAFMFFTRNNFDLDSMTLDIYHYDIMDEFSSPRVLIFNIDGILKYAVPDHKEISFEGHYEWVRINESIYKSLFESLATAKQAKVKFSGRRDYVHEFSEKELSAIRRTIKYLKALRENKNLVYGL